MKTIRRHTFETNSSSCHSVTFFDKEDWDKFKNYDILLKKDLFESHSNKNFLIDLRKDMTYEKPYEPTEEVFKKIKDIISNMTTDQYMRLYNRTYDKDTYYNNVMCQVYEYLKKNFSKNLLISILQNDYTIKYELEKPVKVIYPWRSEPCEVTQFTNDDMLTILTSLDSSDDFIFPLDIYGGEDWHENEVDVFEKENHNFVIVDRNIEC